ncbi:MgtC/SapB family protein [Antarcticirhabdus aurantiaca]|uniref:MgtC/SapB family protein n=1 Tax=Antarcticirhabdus aurantiaca TaxID=2606717 RepID=A0ACD4NJF1_9HYPH|nr:MgtC/SapB family protein [Antarcticirhabdus aurantiaca]WAJ26933.1 MgtC/SapB family protein [Jeongeuplla avenae]
MTVLDMAMRLGLATAVGLALGLDRELRGGAAGIRTHALVSMSSAVITVSALLLFDELKTMPGASIDPLRVVQGLAQAIGFVAAGSIFVSGGNVRNLTSAANIWLAAALGIACGAGQFALVFLGAGFGLVILTLVRIAERRLPGSVKAERRRARAQATTRGAILHRDRGSAKPPVDDDDPND